MAMDSSKDIEWNKQLEYMWKLENNRMNNEIKEILERLEKIDHIEYQTAFEFADSSTFDEMARCFKERMIMADYITNLQEENERYKKIFEAKERFSKIMPEDTDFIILSKADYDRQQENIELTALELKTRNEKAIEYIKQLKQNAPDEKALDKLLEILGSKVN